MNFYYLVSFIFYFAFFTIISLVFYKRARSSSEFILGNRSTSYWMTAIAAQTSDMSDWLFMAYPGLIYGCGIFNIWVAIGLVVFMYLNWSFIAPKLRAASERYNVHTLASFFEKRFRDESGTIRIMTVFFTLYFICFYVAAELIGLGRLFESSFNISYTAGIFISLFLVVLNIGLGGFSGVVVSSFIRGLFLLFSIIIVPLCAYDSLNLSWSNFSRIPFFSFLIPDFSLNTLFAITTLAGGWGLGYFGSPHILINFMGIKEQNKINAAKYVGLSWQIVVLCAATVAGIFGKFMFGNSLANRELVFTEMVQLLFHPLIAGFILCAILSATMSVMTAQILTTASLVSEDCIKRFFPRLNRGENSLLIIRLCIIAIPTLAYAISLSSTSTINDLISYAWSGLGLAFSPAVLAALYFYQTSRNAIIVAMSFGGIVGMVWPLLHQSYLPLVPGFALSCSMILIISLISAKRQKKLL